MVSILYRSADVFTILIYYAHTQVWESQEEISPGFDLIHVSTPSKKSVSYNLS
jgi:hypothetical protein